MFLQGKGRYILPLIAAFTVSATSHATWGAFGAAVNFGTTGTCTFTTSGVTRTGSVKIQVIAQSFDGTGIFYNDVVRGKNTTSAHSANVGIFYADRSLPGPYNFFYDQYASLAPGGVFTGSHFGPANDGTMGHALFAAQCRVGSGSL